MSYWKRKKQTMESEYREKVLGQNSSSKIEKAYMEVGSNIVLQLADKKSKQLMITSALPKEGKTLTCINLAISLTLLNKSVLVIDCNIFNPQIHDVFQIKSEKGLMELLRGECSIEEVIQKNGYENLSIITLGHKYEDGEEILMGDKMHELLKSLGEQFEFILLDAPPINILSSPNFLSRSITGILMIIKERKTTYKDINKTLQKIKIGSNKILGYILTDDIEINKKYKKCKKDKEYQPYL